MTIQDTEHRRTDGATQFWANEEDHKPAPSSPGHTEDVAEDTEAAAREARGRSSEEDEIEQSCENLDMLRKGFTPCQRTWPNLSGLMRVRLRS